MKGIGHTRFSTLFLAYSIAVTVSDIGYLVCTSTRSVSPSEGHTVRIQQAEASRVSRSVSIDTETEAKVSLTALIRQKKKKNADSVNKLLNHKCGISV